MKITVEQIIEDAEVAAVYFRAIVDKGVPMLAAIQLTSSYALAKRINDNQNEKPHEPWENEP